MIGWAQGAGTPVWVLVLLAVLGATLGAGLSRVLSTGGYRIDSDEAGPLPPSAWWPAPVLAALWVFLGWRVGDVAQWAALPVFLLFAWLTVALVWIDADVHRLPDGLVLPSYPALLVLVGVASVAAGDWRHLVRALACMAALYGLYFVMAFVSPNSLGFGDVKLSGLIGLVLGWWSIPQVVLGALGGFLVGGLTALVMLAGRRVGWRSHIAFGPAMLVGALLALAVEFQVVA